jgi:hypothetical protein
VITVCDAGHEQLAVLPDAHHLHWSVPDPVRSRKEAAFDQAVDTLADRISRVAPSSVPGALAQHLARD